MWRAIGLLPENALVGYVSFETQILVHELVFSNMFKVLISQVRGTTSLPLLVFFFFFFSFNYENNYIKKELKVRGSLNGKR